MKKTLSVLICDYDQFYVNGLKLFLKEWFNAHHIDVGFSNHFQQRASADLIFISLSELTTYRAHALCMEMKNVRRNTFIIKNQNDYVPDNIINYTQTIGTVVSRQARLTTMKDHLQKPLEGLESSSITPDLVSTSSVISLRYRLTFRETQILRYLARGVSHATVARYLHISEKTVSPHKRNIMAKLNISRMTELNYWLINEGFFARRESYKSHISNK